jgi:hypothetical protein
MDSKIKQFNAGVHNLLPADKIPSNASQDSLNWITQDGKNILSYGRNLLGAEGLTGRIDGLHYGYKTNGEKVLFRKAGTKIQYLNGTTWTDVITGLTANSDYSFQNYSSLAGAFVFASGTDGLFKINTANPTSYLTMSATYKGKILIDKSRMFMWDNTDITKTSLRLSWIDAQDSTVYTTVTAELLTGTGASYSGTLAFKSIYTLGNCFGLVITGTTSGGVETFTDNKDGTLTGSLGGTGTINYTTGAYAVTFNSAIALQVDQQQTTQNGAIAVGEADATTKYHYLAQSFLAGHPTMGGIRLFKKANTGTPISDVTIYIKTDSTGDPSTNNLTYISIPIATYNAIPDDSEFEAIFPTGATLTIGTKYWITISSGSDNSNHINLGINTAGGYGSGSVKYYNQVDHWQDVATVDLYFKTIYGTPIADYQYENSNSGGITDFSFAIPRVAGTGNLITQDIGGDKIVSVLIGQDGAYYSLKEQSAYRLDISDDDLTFTNLVYRRDMGIPFFRSAISSSKGIVFINTANEEKPVLTILKRNEIGNEVEPVELLSHFKFADYDFSDACIDTFDRYILIACKLKGNETNDRILLCNLPEKTVDISYYKARMFAKDGGKLYCGHTLSLSTYQLFNGFDDDGISLENYWTSKDEDFNSDILKKVRRLRFEGLIDSDQAIEVYEQFDNSGFALIGTILGSGSYVDYTSPETIGSDMIGSSLIGGDGFTEAYPYYCEIKTKTPKFGKRTIKLIAKGIGYADVKMITDWDILTFEQRIPSKFRNKSNVSLSGLQTNLPNP